MSGDELGVRRRLAVPKKNARFHNPDSKVSAPPGQWNTKLKRASAVLILN